MTVDELIAREEIRSRLEPELAMRSSCDKLQMLPVKKRRSMSSKSMPAWQSAPVCSKSIQEVIDVSVVFGANSRSTRSAT